ncbi:DUF192 domain-containing protein [Zeimonas arvi]|uniref:Tetratricopeptide repeat protein n=1 Tax=Zeimonas arvi TaxID=2498847 RepID=A0A5C8NXZ3_9BURK|nr:DUF192 domain-containing protein [Zeimonas arvi]TXL65990.1 tetratricopeptide repeat protein [Zeimonas arvi]
MSLRVSRWTLVRADGSTGTLWLSRATGFVDRLRGLIARPLPEPGQGLWLEPCNAVHSLAMRAPIDLVFIDRARRVLAVEVGLAPWRAAACRRAFSTIELRAGEACRLRIEPGAVLLEAGAPLPVDDPFRVGPHLCQKEPAMAQQVETTKIHRPRAARTRAAAAAAAVTIVSGCATPEIGINASASGPASTPSVPAAGERASPDAIERAVTAAVVKPDAETHAVPVDLPPAPLTAAPGPGPGPGPVTGPAPDSGPAHRAPDGRLAEAETLYRASRFDEALPAFRAIVDADPAHAHAWLRIGNILHRKREWFDALSAYRKAARPQADPAIREKAVYNVALLNLELARQAMKRLERIRSEQGGVNGRLPAPRGAGVSDGAVQHLSDQVAVSYRALSARRAARASATAPVQAPVQAPAPEPGPRSPAMPSAALPVDKPVQVEIRQGGGGR